MKGYRQLELESAGSMASARRENAEIANLRLANSSSANEPLSGAPRQMTRKSA